MANKKQLTERLNYIDSILASGVSSISVDGVDHEFDLDQLKNERAKIERELGKKTRKPMAYRVNLGG